MPGSGHQESLHRHLTFFDVYALSVGSVIGTGIFFLPGKAAAAMGPAAVFPLLIGGCLAGLLVLCYAEAAGRFRGTGGAMRYAQVALGDVAAFEVGWATWIARVVSWAALLNAFVLSLKPLWPGAEGQRIALTLALATALTIPNLRGVQMGGRINTALTVLKLIPLFAFVGIGLFYIDGARFTPFSPQGYESLGATTVLMLYAYVGFEGAVIPAAEMRDPQRRLPRALLLGMGTILLVYAGIWTVCTGTFSGLPGAENPVGEAAATFFGGVGAGFIQIGIVVSVLGINAFMALVTPRALYALAIERLLPTWLGAVDQRRVPARAILITSIAVVALSLSRSFEDLAVISVVARLAQYVPTCFAVLRMRRLEGLPPTTFRAPFGPLLPLTAVAVCVWLLVETPAENLSWGAAAVAAGLILHLAWRLAPAKLGG